MSSRRLDRLLGRRRPRSRASAVRPGPAGRSSLRSPTPTPRQAPLASLGDALRSRVDFPRIMAPEPKVTAVIAAYNEAGAIGP